jgi:glutaredoxin
MIEVYQAEWCPFSHLVREKLTELGVDYICRQVEPYPNERDHLRELSGQDSIPVVVVEGRVLAGATEKLVALLDEVLERWPYEREHARQALAHGAARL